MPPLPAAMIAARVQEFRARREADPDHHQETMASPITKPITKAADSASFVVSDLRAAIKHASPIEVLLIEQLLLDAATLSQQLARFRDELTAMDEA